MDEKKVNVGTRLGSMILDHIIMTIIIMIISIPYFISTFSNAFEISHVQTDPNTFGNSGLVLLIGFSLYFCKDCVLGRSPAKRILKLQIVDNSTGEVASPIKCFIRDIFCILWPVEVIIALVNPSRRIGDFVAGTKLIPYEPLIEKPDPKYIQIIISLIFSAGIGYLIMLPFNKMGSNFAKQKINYVETSFNESDSKAIEKLFADSLGNYLDSSVRIYDKIQNDSVKYVSIIFLLKKNYLADEDYFNSLKSKSTDLLFSMLPRDSFVGQIKFVYKEPGSMQIQTIPLDSRKK